MNCCDWKQSYQDLQMAMVDRNVERGHMTRKITSLEINNKYLETHANLLRKIIADLREVIRTGDKHA
jgi:hypothetical protein